ncbi:hypothetical protein PCK2_000982 [Pneumocystis canis]|nr:hypothetical protein PCK2_000982 [Pneumocystis canis]
MTLDEISLKRKERLNELKKIKKSSDLSSDIANDTFCIKDGVAVNDKDISLSSLPLSFRNYDPELRGPRIGFRNSALKGYETVEVEAQKLKENVDSEVKNMTFDYNEFDISGLKPNRLNCDLKRQMQIKIERLKRGTDTAIVKLIRKRLINERTLNI